MRAIRIASFALTIGAALSAMWPAARPAQAAAFAPQVSVWVSDDAPGSHPDITTTIDIPEGPLMLRSETLTPVGGGIHRWGEIPEGTVIGRIGGFVTIPGADGHCNQRYLYNDVPILEADPNTAALPPFLRELAPGAHAVRYTADVAGTPVNVIVDDVTIDGVSRLRATTFVGDPAHPPPNCAPFRSRVIMLGDLHTTPPPQPVGTAPPTAGPRVYDFTFTAWPDASGNSETAHRSVTATVQPGLRVRTEGSRVAWDAVPGVASYWVSGPVDYTTTCALIRRLVIRQAGGNLAQRLAGDVTSVAVPPPPGPDYEVASVFAFLSAYDAEGVLLAVGNAIYSRDFHSCWYPPGQEPLLHVAPDAGPCTGTVTFTGERFPAGVNVEITMPPYGSDVSGLRVAVAPAAADGRFSVTAALPESAWPASACTNASMFPEGKIAFAAYNADEPHGMQTFASVHYTASIPPGWAPPGVFPVTAGQTLTGPSTGTGLAPARAPWPLAAVLAILGAAAFGCGLRSLSGRQP